MKGNGPGGRKSIQETPPQGSSAQLGFSIRGPGRAADGHRARVAHSCGCYHAIFFQSVLRDFASFGDRGGRREETEINGHKQTQRRNKEVKQGLSRAGRKARDLAPAPAHLLASRERGQRSPGTHTVLGAFHLSLCSILPVTPRQISLSPLHGRLGDH